MAKKIGDIPTERALLAGLVQHGSDAHADVMDILTTDSFVNDKNQIIFKCVTDVLNAQDEVDLPSLMASASRLNLYDAINNDETTAYIRSLFNFPSALKNVRKHAITIAKFQVGRQIQDIAKSIYNKAQEIDGSETVEEILGIAEQPVFDLSLNVNNSGEGDTELLGEEAEEYIEYLIENQCEIIGMPTPWNEYNHCIGGGCRRGSVNLIGARPKVGKTTLAKDCGFHIANNLNNPVLVLDTEMNKKDQYNRLLSSISKISINRIETGQFANDKKELSRVKDAAKKIKESPYYYKSIAGKAFEDILSIIRRWIIKKVGFDEEGNVNDCLVIYDYFKLMSSDGLDDMKEYQALGFQISNLVNFAIKYDFPCLAFVQLNRDGISAESTDVISQSDRLLWLCASFSIFKRKEPEEIAEDGPENGNMKLVPVETRYGPGIDGGDYINLRMDGGISTIEEIGLNSMANSDDEDPGFGAESEDEDYTIYDEEDVPF